MILAIDSGADMGWALFHNRILARCGLGKIPTPLPGLSRIVIERPHTGRTEARKKDVITLAIRAGEAGGLLRHLTSIEPEYIEPTRWKGSTPKNISAQRTRAKLSEAEAALLNAVGGKSKQHNVVDAVGIGLYLCGR